MSVPHKRQSLNDFEHRLTQPMVLEDGRPPKVLTSTLNTLSGFVVIAILWGALTSVQEMTTATGQIVPRGQILNVQHLEGGIAITHFDDLEFRVGESLRHQTPDRFTVIGQKNCSSHNRKKGRT